MAGQDRCSATAATAEEGGLASEVIPHLQGDENIILGETPELQIIIDSEARLVKRTPQEKQRYVADDVNDDVTVPDHDGEEEEEEEEEEEWVDMGQGPEIPEKTPEGYYNPVFEDIQDNGNVIYKHVPQ